MRLGVVGWPVAHSLSPAFQNAALQAVGLDGWHYGRLPVPPELFAETVRALPQAGYRGVNVTIPHKQAALSLADAPTARARAIGAANTLLFERGDRPRAQGASDAVRITADNTDAPGMIAALPFSPHGRSALVLGAGGSARAAVWALREAGAAEVLVWNRDRARAERLCAELGGRPVSRPEPAELLVHCTPIGLGPGEDLSQLPLAAADLRDFRLVVDFVYRQDGTPLTLAASSQGVPTVDGLELLLAQGALSFELFTGHAAPVAAMRQALGR